MPTVKTAETNGNLRCVRTAVAIFKVGFSHACMDFSALCVSIGSVVGEKIARE